MDVISQLWTELVRLIGAYPIPAAFITLASVASAIWTNHKNRVATIFGHSMQAVTHLDQRWESEDLWGERCRAAQYLLETVQMQGARESTLSQEELDDGEDSLYAILNFLETVGCFVRTGAIGGRTAWQLFGSATELFAEAAQFKLAEERRRYKTVYSELQYLYLVARVEEHRRDWPAAGLWRRCSALALTWTGRRASVFRFFDYPYAFFTGKIFSGRELPPLFSTENQKHHLERLVRVGVRKSSKADTAGWTD